MQKKLFVLTVTQLTECNLHLGESQNLWNCLNYDFIIGKRLNIFILDINFNILMLKKSLHLIELLSFKKNKILIYFGNSLVNSYLSNYFKYFKKLNFNFLIYKWMAGLLTNFKNFRLYLYPLLNQYYQLLLKVKFSAKNFTVILKNLKFIGLANLSNLPQLVIGLKQNAFLINETRLLKIPIVQQVNTNFFEQEINQSTFLLPFNINNLQIYFLYIYSFLFAILYGYLKQKKLFLVLIVTHLMLNKKLFFNKDLLVKKFLLNYSFIVNLFKYSKNFKKQTYRDLNKKNLLLNKFFLLRSL